MLLVNAWNVYLTETAMNQHQFKRFHLIFDVIANVSCKLGCVKRAVSKISSYSLGMFVFAGLVMGSGAAHAQDSKARAIQNSTHLLNFVDGVIPEFTDQILHSIESGAITRLAPEMPVWILSADTGKIMFYQGQPAFAGQAASRLVDDNGFRFGLRAVENARNSRSSWVTLHLGGAQYSAYCATKAPFVVCSLIQ